MSNVEKVGSSEDRPIVRASSDASSGPSEIGFAQPDEVPYGCFSNYFMRPIKFAGSQYSSAEHAYFAQKARRAEVREWVAQAPTPQLAALAGGGLPPDEVVRDWSARQIVLMAEVLQAKFTQHRDLGDLLLSTGDAPIAEIAEEDNPINRFWSKVNGEGQNMLGVILMNVRERLRGSGAK